MKKYVAVVVAGVTAATGLLVGAPPAHAARQSDWVLSQPGVVKGNGAAGGLVWTPNSTKASKVTIGKSTYQLDVRPSGEVWIKTVKNGGQYPIVLDLLASGGVDMTNSNVSTELTDSAGRAMTVRVFYGVGRPAKRVGTLYTYGSGGKVTVRARAAGGARNYPTYASTPDSGWLLKDSPYADSDRDGVKNNKDGVYWDDPAVKTAPKPTAAQNARFSRAMTLENPTFYPHKRDGFKDRVFFWDYGSIVHENVQARIYNSKNNLIRTVSQNRKGVTAWDGRTKTGRVAPKGTYRVVLTATFPRTLRGEYYDQPVRATKRVKIARGTVTQRIDAYREGTKTTTRKKSGNAYFASAGDGTLIMDCWGGDLTATYRFKIPANAKNIRHEVAMRKYFQNLRGKTTVTGKRVNKTTYVVTVKVTSWHSQQIDSAEITYTARFNR